jgi:general transcription factor 3C polypeptide 3 (transcription factor C subunit 4)
MNQLISFSSACIVVGQQPDNLEARLRLANVLDDTGHKAEALEIVSEGDRSLDPTPDCTDVLLVLRIRALKDQPAPRGRGPNRQDPDAPQSRQSKADKAATQTLNKRILEQQMSTTMQELWQQVQSAEQGITSDPAEEGALDRFVMAAGTMIENYRLARSNFTKGRVRDSVDAAKILADHI